MMGGAGFTTDPANKHDIGCTVRKPEILVNTQTLRKTTAGLGFGFGFGLLP